MFRSGYQAKDRDQIIHGSLSAHQCRLRLDREGIRPLYRSREYQREEREKEKIMKRESWFQKGKSGKKLETVLFVAATPSSELAQSINKRLTEAKSQ